MAASRFLAATAARVVLCYCATGHRKSYLSGCSRLRWWLTAVFLKFGADYFPFKIPGLLKRASKSSFFRFGAELRFGAAISVAIGYVKASLCKRFCVQKLLCVKTFLCKNLCLQASLCKSLLCEKDLLCGKAPV